MMPSSSEDDHNQTFRAHSTCLVAANVVFPGGGTNSAPPVPLPGFEGTLRGGGRERKERRGKDKKERDGKDGKSTPPLYPHTHRRSQDFVWDALFLTKKADDLFLVVALKERLNTPPNLTRAKTVLKIDSCSG